VSGEWHEIFDDSSSSHRANVRLFTVAEARALIPELLPMLRDLRAARRRVVDLRDRVEGLTPAMRQNGHAAQAAELEQGLVAGVQHLTRILERLTTLGVLVKDMEHGLIDFPALRDGRIILLCWRMDEPTVAYWHEVDSGFGGRRPL
jgi:hypothetical protein